MLRHTNTHLLLNTSIYIFPCIFFSKLAEDGYAFLRKSSFRWDFGYSSPRKKLLLLILLVDITCDVDFRCGQSLSAGNASASSEAKTTSCGIFSWDCAYSSHQKPCCFSRRTRRASAVLHRTKKIGFYFRGVDCPSLQSTVIKVN